jgi:hypothetical protein
MKDIFTEIQELGIDPNTDEGAAKFAEIINERYPGRTVKPTFPAEIKDLPDTIVQMIRNSNPNSAFEEAVQQKFQHAKHVLLTKHKDYGPKNIAFAPGGALNGLRVRMHDKLSRINHLMDTGAKPQNESLKDSFLDLANYAIIAMLVIDEEWPNE